MKFTEPSGLNHVAAFHHLFDAPILQSPTIPSQDRCDLRVNLLQEELNELKESIDSGDLVGIADALGDIQYVLSGAILEFGMAAKFATIFDEIQRSNMSKTCKTMLDAEKTALYYESEKGFETKIVQKDDVFLVYRLPDFKVLKSINYSEADIKGMLL
ncbi:MAG: nucleoside triphosphate pyrophosphohydrolase family protein [Saprospiraceae bacterium]